jgi:hypothetical protein
MFLLPWKSPWYAGLNTSKGVRCRLAGPESVRNVHDGIFNRMAGKASPIFIRFLLFVTPILPGVRVDATEYFVNVLFAA